MKVRWKHDDNARDDEKHTFELTVRLNRKREENEACFQLYESGRPIGDISKCRIILYDDIILYVPSGGENEISEEESEDKTLFHWFDKQKIQPQGEAQTTWSTLTGKYKDSLKNSEGEE